MYCFCIHLAVLQSYLSLFSHITCIHLGYSTWSKNWLINFWAMYFLVYAFFMCELRKIFFLKDMMDNQCANIFSTYATVNGSHSAMFAFYWKREYFFFMCILNLVFFIKKTWFVSFYLSLPPLFFPKACFVFPIFIGEKFF